MLYTVSSHNIKSESSETRTRILEATWKLVEKRQGQGIRMSDIAKAAGISRQALYLHFASRVDLLVATTHYIDKVRNLHERNARWREATAGMEMLELYIEFWANYIPEIYGLGKALMAVQDTDEVAATAWAERMASLRRGCRRTVEALYSEGLLTPELTLDEATDLFWTMISVRNWEQLTTECGWSKEEYTKRMQVALKRMLIEAK